MDGIESRMASFRSELNQIGSQMERLSRLDVDRLNNTIERLPKVEESLLSLVRHLEAGTLKSIASIPAPGKTAVNDVFELFPEFEASGSGKGKHFVVRTDQRSLHFLLERWEVDAEYQKWLLKLMPYNFSIQYRPGSSNSAANALSRIPDNATLSLLSAPIITNFEELKEMVAADPFLSNIQHAVQQDPASYPGFSLVEGHLHCNGKLAIPAESTYVPMLLREFHNSGIGGHAGIRRTYNRLAAEFYWKGMKKNGPMVCKSL